MLIDDEGYVKPASRESRLVMIQLEPRAEKETKGNRKHRGKNGNKNKNKSKRQRMHMDLFIRLKEACCDWEGLHGNSCA
jgi:hypothetical protein